MLLLEDTLRLKEKLNSLDPHFRHKTYRVKEIVPVIPKQYTSLN